MSNIKNSLGKKIKKIRKEQGLTQEKLAELINIEIPSLSNIETGKYAPSTETLQKLCEVLNKEPWEFYCFNVIDNKKMMEFINKKLTKKENIKIVYSFLKAIE